MHGDFDDIKATAFSSDGSKVAFGAQQQDHWGVLIFEIATRTMTTVPSQQGLPTSSMSWSPDAKRLAVEIPRRDRSPLVAVLDLETGNVRTLGEGSDPAWSPNGEWITYFDPDGAKCFVVHPDGTGARVVKRLRQALFSYRRFGCGPVWSPDSRRLLLDEMKGDGDYHDTVLLDLESGREIKKAGNGLPVFGWAALPLSGKR
jgi:Tol biopolymer transport system component